MKKILLTALCFFSIESRAFNVELDNDDTQAIIAKFKQALTGEYFVGRVAFDVSLAEGRKVHCLALSPYKPHELEKFKYRMDNYKISTILANEQNASKEDVDGTDISALLVKTGYAPVGKIFIKEGELNEQDAKTINEQYYTDN